MSRPTGLKAEESRRTLGRLFAPIQGGLVDADRIFQEELQSRFPFVQALVEHCGDYQGKRLRPALVLLAGGACGGITPAHPVLAVFDHHGRPLHLGRAKRLASADQRLALIAASGGCTRPGCDAPATLTAVHHIREWRDGGATDITNEDLACDACHAFVHDGPGGWETRVASADSEHPGRTEWIPPPHLDYGQPRINTFHHPDKLLAPDDDEPV